MPEAMLFDRGSLFSHVSQVPGGGTEAQPTAAHVTAPHPVSPRLSTADRTTPYCSAPRSGTPDRIATRRRPPPIKHTPPQPTSRQADPGLVRIAAGRLLVAHITTARFLPAHITAARLYPAHIATARPCLPRLTASHVTAAHLTASQFTATHLTAAHPTAAHPAAARLAAARPTASRITCRAATAHLISRVRPRGAGLPGGSGYGSRCDADRCLARSPVTPPATNVARHARHRHSPRPVLSWFPAGLASARALARGKAPARATAAKAATGMPQLPRCDIQTIARE